MRTKSRSRGDKEPVGRTKAVILLFLADRGESTFTELREHLAENYNIRNPKDLRIHLNDLSDTGKLDLIVKASNGNGNACSYRLKDGSCSLKKLYNYLNAHGLGPELMRTKHFREFTSSLDFFITVKINLVNSILSDFCRRLASDDGTASIQANMGHVSKKHRDVLLKWMDRVRKEVPDEPISRNFLELSRVARSMDEEKMETYIRQIYGRGVSAIGKEGFIALASDLMIPDEYMDRITTIMQLSPGAFDCVMNLECDNPLFPCNPFMAYAISQLLSMDELKKETGLTVIECCEYGKGLPRLVTEPPLYLIARSQFISDMVSGKLTIDPVPPETLRMIFPDKI